MLTTGGVEGLLTRCKVNNRKAAMGKADAELDKQAIAIRPTMHKRFTHTLQGLPVNFPVASQIHYARYATHQATVPTITRLVNKCGRLAGKGEVKGLKCMAYCWSKGQLSV
jgi:hypothetical protein